MLVIDTHVLVWWVGATGDLSAKSRRSIERTLDGQGEVIVSSISAWEVAMLVQKGRLLLSMEVERRLEEAAAIDGVRFHPVDNEVAVKSASLPGEFHKDPADRMIVATARKLAVPLVTANEKILCYEHVKTIW